MSQKLTEGFKIQAVEKALNRSPEITLVKIAETLGMSRSALQRWITQSKNYELESTTRPMLPLTNKEKSPQDCSSEERFQIIIESNGLSKKATNELCRAQGAFLHHIKVWNRKLYSFSKKK